MAAALKAKGYHYNYVFAKNAGHTDGKVTRQALQADSTFAPARFYLGLALIDAGHRNEAIKELEQVVRAGGAIADAHRALGSAYIDAGRAAEAIETLNQGLRLDPSNSELHIALARAYRTSGLLEKADAELTRGRPKRSPVSDSSDYPYQQVDLDFQLERGMVKLQRGQLAAAAEAFEKVLEMEPKHEIATRELAEAKRRLRAKKPGGAR
jgi:Tfp pilus assembly protein PilF